MLVNIVSRLAPAAGLMVLTLILGCGPSDSTVAAYTLVGPPVLVRVVDGTTTADYALYGVNDYGFVYIGSSIPAGLRIQFLDPQTCEVLATADGLPRNSRVGLNIGDSGDLANVVLDNPGDDRRVLLPSSNACKRNE